MLFCFNYEFYGSRVRSRFLFEPNYVLLLGGGIKMKHSIFLNLKSTFRSLKYPAPYHFRTFSVSIFLALFLSFLLKPFTIPGLTETFLNNNISYYVYAGLCLIHAISLAITDPEKRFGKIVMGSSSALWFIMSFAFLTSSLYLEAFMFGTFSLVSFATSKAPRYHYREEQSLKLINEAKKNLKARVD